MLFFAILISQLFADYSEGMTYTYATTAKITVTATATNVPDRASVSELAFKTHVSCIKQSEDETIFLLRADDLDAGQTFAQDGEKPSMQPMDVEQLKKPIVFVKTADGKIGNVYYDPTEPEEISSFKVGLVQSFRTVRTDEEKLVEIDTQGRHYTHVKTNPKANRNIVFLCYSSDDFIDFRDAGAEPSDIAINVNETLEYDGHLIQATYDSCHRVTPVRRANQNSPNKEDVLGMFATENIVFLHLSTSASNVLVNSEDAKGKSAHDIVTELFPSLERVPYLTEEEYDDRARRRPPKRAISNSAPAIQPPQDPPEITVSETHEWNNTLGSKSLGLDINAYAYTGSNNNCNSSEVIYYIASGAEAELSIMSKPYILLQTEASLSNLEEVEERPNWMYVNILGVEVYNKAFPELTCEHQTITLYKYEPNVVIPIVIPLRLAPLEFKMFMNGTMQTDVSGSVCQYEEGAGINVDSQAHLSIGASLTVTILFIFKVQVTATATLGEQIIAEGTVNPEECYMEWMAKEIREPFKAKFKITAGFALSNEEDGPVVFQQSNDEMDVWNSNEDPMNKTHVNKRRTMDLSTRGKKSSASFVGKAKEWATSNPVTAMIVVFAVVSVVAVGAVIGAVIVVKKVRSRRSTKSKEDTASAEPLLPTA